MNFEWSKRLHMKMTFIRPPLVVVPVEDPTFFSRVAPGLQTWQPYGPSWKWILSLRLSVSKPKSPKVMNLNFLNTIYIEKSPAIA